MPMDATAELRGCVPRAPGAAKLTTIALRATALHLQPTFGLVPLVHDAVHALHEAAEACLQVGPWI